MSDDEGAAPVRAVSREEASMSAATSAAGRNVAVGNLSLAFLDAALKKKREETRAPVSVQPIDEVRRETLTLFFFFSVLLWSLTVSFPECARKCLSRVGREEWRGGGVARASRGRRDGRVRGENRAEAIE